VSEAPPPLTGMHEPALLTRIARELATETFTPEQILQRYNINQADLDAIAANPFFQRVLADYTKEWQSLASTQKRVAASALMALEENLPVLADRMGSRASGLADAVAAAKLFKELGGIAAPAPQNNAQQGGGFAIRIDFGSHKVSLEQTQEPKLIEEKPLELPGDSIIPAKDSAV